RDLLPLLVIGGGELPGDRGGRKHLDEGVEPEADERGRRGGMTGDQRDDRLYDVPGDRDRDDDADPAAKDGPPISGEQGGGHRPAPESQQPGTEQCGSTQGALSSTARVTSTSAVSAAAMCGSAIS